MTHSGGHTLDFLITQDSDQLVPGILEVSIVGLCNSNGELPDDHRIVSCNLEIKRTGGLKRETDFRAFRNINIVDFKKDIRGTCLSQSTDEGVDELIDTYNMNIKDIVDQHEPEQKE